MKKLLAILLLLALTGCATGPLLGREFALDTVVDISLYGADEATLGECFALISHYEHMFSRTLEGTDIWNINHAAGRPVEVSPETAELITLALEVSKRSRGAFDITIGPVSALWDFKKGVIPPSDQLSAAMELVDYEKVTLSGQTVTLPAGMQLDLGGIAKGFIADKLVQMLSEKGVKSAMINLGGNVYALGSKAGKPFKVGIQGPDGRAGDIFGVVDAVDCSVVTSGVYERGFTHEGKLYHHLIDPATGLPVDNGAIAVSIIAKSSALADALTTACFVLGPDKGLELAREYGVEAVFIMRDGAVRASAGWRWDESYSQT